MRVNKKKYFDYFLFALIILLVGFVLYNRVNYLEAKKKFNTEKEELKTLKKQRIMVSKIEGNFIWDLIKLDKNVFDSLKQVRQYDYFLLALLDKLSCGKCYQFHQDYIKSLDKEIKIIFISDDNTKLLNTNFPASTILPDYKYGSNKLKGNYILFSEAKGKIIYADFINFKDFIGSELFYKKVSRFVK
mgnify:CR=1 FL=1